jgi:RNA recognition motif-containing protein
MVQHTLLVKNVANSLLRVELAKLLGDQHKIVTVSFRNQPGKKGGIKYALVVVESQADLATVSGLLDKKTVHGKELKVSAAKAPQEKGSYAARVARLKSLEKFPSVWPAPTYKNVANSDPLKNLAFPPAYVHGERLSIEPAKTIKKKVPAPSRALYLSKLPKTVNKKQILEAFKNVKIQHTILTKNKKKLNYGFLLFKNAEERKKAQDAAKDGKITIGEHTIAVQEANKFAKQTVVEPVVKITKAADAPAAAKKDLSVNGIAKKRFTAYRINLHNRKQRLARLAAIKKLKEHKQAVSQGKAQPRVVRKLQAKKTIVKPNPEVAKKAQKKAARKARHAKAKLNSKNKKTVKVAAKAPAAAETATA